LGNVKVQVPDELAAEFTQLRVAPQDTFAEITVLAELFEGAQRRQEYLDLVALADTWTSAFFWPLVCDAPDPPTQEWFATLKTNPRALPAAMEEKINEITADRGFFHFETAFVDVFTSDRGGFDVVVGNPPYLGGMKISTTFGDKVLNFLKLNHPAQTGGRVDLAAYFLRRGYDLLRSDGHLCFITTNTIGEGDTRDASIRPMRNWGATIADAMRSVPWEGEATVSVAVLHLSKGAWDRNPTLDGEIVDEIFDDLSSSQSGAPEPLESNQGMVSVGTNVLGEGFWIDAPTRERLIELDPLNAEVIKPFIGGRQAVQFPDPAVIDRWVIDFESRSLEEAERYVGPMAIVRERVKPQRDNVRRQRYRDFWWQLGERSSHLYEQITAERLRQVIAIPHVSKAMMPVFLPANAMFQDKLFVFVSDDDALFGVLSSSFHWLWAAKRCTTMRVDPTYNPGAIFLTFALPPFEKLEQVGNALKLAQVECRSTRSIGLTGLYNLVSDPNCVDEDVNELRHRHQLLDDAIASAYQWPDLVGRSALGFHDTRFGVRWMPSPDVQRDIEGRLLELNLQRTAHQE
jgi:hypothetical protein